MILYMILQIYFNSLNKKQGYKNYYLDRNLAIQVGIDGFLD